MKTFDLKALQSFPYPERQKNVFLQSEEFKMRIIEPKEGGELPECQMRSNVVFLMLSGEVEVMVNNNKSVLKERELLVSKPALFSMKAVRPSR